MRLCVFTFIVVNLGIANKDHQFPSDEAEIHNLLNRSLEVCVLSIGLRTLNL